MKKRLLLISIVVMIALVFAVGCGKSSDSGSNDNKPADKQQWLSIATGGTGGVYYPYGGGMATIINQNVKNVNATAEVTQASVENTNLVVSGEAQLGLIMGDVGFQAYYGTGRFENDKKDIRTVFMMYPNIYHLVTLADSGINTVNDLKGKRVSIGAPGSGTEFKTNLVLGELGIDYKDLKVQQLPFADQTNSLRDGNLDVGIWSVAAPTSSITELTATNKIKIIPFSQEESEKVNKEFPFYNPGVIKGGTYPGVSEDVPTLSVWNIVIASADYDDDLVYEIVKAIFENQKNLVDIHISAEWTTPENTLANSFFPLHAGAVRYFKEIGMDIPQNLIPPEYK